MNPPGNQGYYASQYSGHVVYPQLHQHPPNQPTNPYPSGPGYAVDIGQTGYPSYNQTPPAAPPQGPPPLWIPNAFEVSLLDGWFRSMDPTGIGAIQGAHAVGFLKRSNLHRDTLRKIWSLVDTQNRGYIDKRQFAMIMRLVALSCAHPHVPVSMERYYQTCHDSHYPLPPMTGGAEAPPIQQHLPQSVPHNQMPLYQHQPQYHQPFPDHSAPALPPPLSHTESVQSVPAVVTIDDDAISLYSDISTYSATPGSTSLARSSSGVALQHVSEDMDDFEDFQGPASTIPTSVSAPAAQATTDEDDFDDFQGAVHEASSNLSLSHTEPIQMQNSSPHSSLQEHSPHRPTGAVTDPTKKKKSIEEMIALVAHDPLNTHAPSLKQWQTSHGSLEQQPPQAVQKEMDLLVLDDDANSAGGLPAISRKANTAMSAFDEMAELDVQASNEEWDDFADETTAPVAPVASVVTSAVSDNPFDQFITVQEVVASGEEVGEDEEFGDFDGFQGAADTSSDHTVSIQKNGVDSVGFESFHNEPVHAPTSTFSFDNALITTPAAPPADIPAILSEDDDFGDFAEHTSNDLGGSTREETAFEATFSDPSSSQWDVQGEIDHGSDDEFGDFSTTETPTPMEPQRFDSSDVRNIPVKVSEDDDDFGDFATTGVTEMPEPGRNDENQTDDFDDFNDFEEAPPVAHVSTSDQVDFFGDAFGDLGDTQDAPVPVLEDFSFTPQKADTKSTPVRQLSATDLLDSVLMDSSLYASPPSNATVITPTHASAGASSGGESFLDDFLPKSTPVTSSSTAPSASASSGRSSFLLDFESFSTGSKQLPELVDRNLTLDELETLFSVLMDLNRFAEAYGVGQQAEAVRKIKELGIKKMQAVENDDLELAIQLRDEINRVKESELVASRDDERYWLEIAHSGKKNNNIEDYVELVETLDPDCVGVIRKKYIISAPSSSTSNSDRALFYANALRALQLVVAVRTSHREYVQHWIAVMTNVSRILLDSLGSIEEFKSLSDADRNAVTSTEQMNVFVKGMLRVVDVGKWVGASCQEAEVEVATADRILSLCFSVVDALATCGLLDLESNYHNMAVQELCFASSRLMGLMGRKNAHFCSLTLRPVCTSSSIGGSEMVHHLGLPYMQAAISLWTKNFPNKQPPSNPLSTQ